MVPCPICQHELKNQQGLSGHLRFKHNSAPGTTTGLAAGSVAGEAILEDILWLLTADIQALSTDTRAQIDQLNEALVSLGDRMDQLLTSVESTSRNTATIEQINTKLDQLTDAIARQAEQHQPGFCEEKICSANCHSRLLKERSDVVERINHRLPNTKEDLRRIEVAMKTGDISELPMAALHLLDEVGSQN